MGEINVEEIMKEIRREIAERGEEQEQIPFDEIPVMGASAAAGGGREPFQPAFFDKNVALLNQSWEICAYRPLSGNPIKVFFKRVLRKLIKFYIEPITRDETDFNSFTVRSMNSVAAYIAEQQKRDAETGHEIDFLKKQVKLLEREFEELRGK